MAATSNHTSRLIFSTLIFYFPLAFFVLQASSVEFDVNGEQGWVVPSSKDNDVYNEWASKNRFKVNDTLHFVYKDDSVLRVTEAEYYKCEAPHPIFFSNSGDTELLLENPGLYFFISGISGHCQKGQRMIVKVLNFKPIFQPPFISLPPHADAAQLKTDVSAAAAPANSLFLSTLLGIMLVSGLSPS